MPGAVSFRPFVREDLDILRVWLAAPHGAHWWREPSTADHVERADGPYADGTASDAALFVLLEGREPVGFFQRYRHRDHPHGRRPSDSPTRSASAT